ncbi:MAG: dynamin family protein [Acidimicrobiia bacterium]
MTVTTSVPGFGSAADQVLALIGTLEPDTAGSAYATELASIRERLSGPLRVAIAGRVKAGKSTMLNALVGERLAPTDAGECTRIVSWYRRGQSYQVSARLVDGQERAIPFQRGDGALQIELGGLTEREISVLEVRWPASTLEQVTLIDTPGLASLNDENSRRTREFLEVDADSPSDADAVIYLMRHAHRSDVDFLSAFMDRSVTAASPVNAVAVLSRADEIGAGRLDAMESASRIAARYRDDPTLRELCATVVPLAGLLAETGLTMREDEAAALRALAASDPEQVEQMLLSADHFCDLHASDLTVEVRRSLLDRLGMFGVRLSLQEIRDNGATTAATLAPRLVERSGLTELRRVIAEHFLPRARTLQARSALVALRSLARDMRAANPALAESVDREAERIEASGVEFARIRAAHLVASGSAQVRDGEREELDRLLLAGTPAAALGIGGGASADSVKSAALSTIERWRARAGDPFADQARREVCETAARTGEAIYAGVAA